MTQPNSPQSPIPSPTHPTRPQPNPKPSNLLQWLILGALVLALGAIGYYFWQKNNLAGATADKSAKAGGKTATKGGAVTTVTVTPSLRQDITLWQEIPATVTPLQQTIIRPTQAGQISALYFQDGQYVKKGQILAKLDDRLITASLKQAQAVFNQSQAQLTTAKLTQQRYQSLLAQHAVSQQEIDQYTGQVNLIQAQQAAAQSQIQSAQVQLDNTVIRAPFAGQVGIHKASVGAQVTPTDTNGIVTLTQTQPIAVSFGVPDVVNSRQSPKGLPVQIWSFDTNSQLLANSQISTVDAQVDTTTGSLPAQALVANTNQKLSAGQSVKVKLVTQRYNQALTVPLQAVQKGLDGYFVLTVAGENTDNAGQKATMQAVKMLGQNDQVAIIEGIEAGVNVIIDGAAKVRDGSMVKTVMATTGTPIVSGTASASTSNPPSTIKANPTTATTARDKSTVTTTQTTTTQTITNPTLSKTPANTQEVR